LEYILDKYAFPGYALEDVYGGGEVVEEFWSDQDSRFYELVKSKYSKVI